MSEISKLLELYGMDEDQSKDAYMKWYAWLQDKCKSKDISDIDVIEDKRLEDMIHIGKVPATLVDPNTLLPVQAEVYIAYIPHGHVIDVLDAEKLIQILAGLDDITDYREKILSAFFNKLSPKWVGTVIKVKYARTEYIITGMRSKKIVTSDISSTNMEQLTRYANTCFVR